MSNAEKIIASFLKQEGVSKSVCRYELRHSAKGRAGNTVESFDITEALNVNELDNLAAIIIARAQLDADGIGPAIQRYTLSSYIDGQDSPSGRINFRLRGTSDLDLDGDDEAGEEAPNQRGLMTQLMRHNEHNNRTLVTSVGAILTSMARRMESSDRMVEKLMEDRFRSFEIIEEAYSRKHERDMEMEQVKSKEQRIAFGIQKVSMLIPVILDKLAGSKNPSSGDPMVLMFEELIGSMSPTQMEGIRRGLGSEQQILFITMLKRFQERKALPSGGDSVNGTPQKEN